MTALINKLMKSWTQESKMIRQWPINWCTSPMTILKIIPSVDYNKWLKRLDTQLYKPSNQNELKSLKLLGQRKRKRYYKTLVILILCCLIRLRCGTLRWTTWILDLSAYLPQSARSRYSRLDSIISRQGGALIGST